MLAAQTNNSNLRSTKEKRKLMASEVEQIITELKKLESKIEKRFDSVDKELSAIKDDIRKINQFVPMENADFRVHVSQTNGKPKKEVPKKKRVATK